MSRTSTAVLSMVCLVFPTACASGPAGPETEVAAPALGSSGAAINVPVDPPADFSLDVTVLTGRGVEAGQPPRRLVVFADGSLHSGGASGLGFDALPPWTRTIDRDRMAGLWTRCRELGFADPDRGIEVGAFERLRPGRDEVVAIAVVTARDARWAFLERRAASAPADAAMKALVDHLEDLAWADDADATWARRRPRRQDFGPDPYARYRR